MNFESQYVTAINAFDAKLYVEATNAYLGLLETAKDRIIEMLENNADARLVHSEMAMQYGLQKTLLRRIQGDEVVTIDLSLFTRNLPLFIRYSENTCQYLNHFKTGSPTFANNLNVAAERYALICEAKLDGVTPPAVVPTDAYAAMWVASDLIDLEPYLPETLDSYINIGCGGGLFDVTYIKGPRRSASAQLIDIDQKARQCVEVAAKEENLVNTRFLNAYDEDTLPPNLVLSVRSCAYLYDIEIYNALFRRMESGGRVILDVSHEREAKTTGYFKSLGATAHRHARLNDTSVQLIEYVF